MARKKISLLTVHILFVFLIKMIISPTPQTEIVYDKEPNYSSLPNEVPDLIAPFKELARFDPNIHKIKNIIGVLPYPEQYALLQAYKMKSEDEWFSLTTYNKFATDNAIFSKEIEAISDYVTEFEKKLAYGIGCIKSVTNNYFRSGKDNVEYQDKIYSNLNAILTAQGDVNKAQAQFIQDLETILFQRRNLLLTIHQRSAKEFINDPPDKQDNIVSIKYSNEEATSIITAFKAFLNSQKTFTEKLTTHSMNAIMNLSNMDGCRNYKDPNLNAGESSKGVEKPEIDYRKGRVQTGVNDEARIREDKRTTNGFLIDGGFQQGFASKGNELPNIEKMDETDKAKHLKIINNCFGVFASGGQDDKDACRDVMIKKCGIDLDYQCKKSGFYDYIIANPFTSVDIASYKNNQALLKFIDKYFIQNSIAIKPSGIIGFNTIVQKLEKELTESAESSDTSDSIIRSVVQGDEIESGAALQKINIFEATPNSSGDPSLKQTLMDEFLYNFLDNHSSFYKVKYNIILCFILLCFL